MSDQVVSDDLQFFWRGTEEGDIDKWFGPVESVEIVVAVLANPSRYEWELR